MDIDQALRLRAFQFPQIGCRNLAFLAQKGREETAVEIEPAWELTVKEQRRLERGAHRADEDQQIHRRHFPLAQPTLHRYHAGGFIAVEQGAKRSAAGTITPGDTERGRLAKCLQEVLDGFRYI